MLMDTAVSRLLCRTLLFSRETYLKRWHLGAKDLLEESIYLADHGFHAAVKGGPFSPVVERYNVFFAAY